MKKKIIVSLLTITLCIPLFIIKPKADNTQTSSHTITSYGDYTFQQGTSTSTFNYEVPGFPINLTFNSGSWMRLDYNFKDKYSGTMKFTVTSSLDWILNNSPVMWSASADGEEATCYISATTSMTAVGKTKTFTIIFTNATAVHFGVVHNANTTFFNSSQSITISNASFTSQPDETDIYTDLHQLRLWWDLYVPGMSTNISNIANDVSSILNNTSNINTNITTIKNDISILKSYVDGIESYIDGLENMVDDVESLLTNIANIEKIQALPLYTSNMLFWIIKRGTLQFDNVIPYIYYDSSINSGDYTNANRIRINANSTVSMYIYTTSSTSTSTVNVYHASSFSGTPVQGLSYNSNANPSYPLYLRRIDFTNYNNEVVYIDVEFDFNAYIFPLFLGDKTQVPDEIHQLFGDEYDNTYTRLLQSINSGISSLNGSYDTSTYDSYEQTMDSLNDNMRTRFNNSSSSFQSNVNSILTPDQVSGGSNTIFQQFHFQAVNNIFTGFLNDLFTTFPLFRYLLIFGLLLLVLGVLI